MYKFNNSLPTNHNISDKLFQNWHFLWNACADEDIINRCIVYGESLPESDASIGDGGANSSVHQKVRFSKVSWIHKNDECKDIYDWFIDKVDRINYWHYGLNLTGMEPLQYTRYPLNGHYNYHHDITIRKDNIMRKLSIVVSLSDRSDYEGGEFNLMPHGINPLRVKFGKGDLIAFPSWVPHKVEPVTSGHRITLVGWVCGPKFI